MAGAGRGRELAIDALVAATTIRLGGGMILTHDPGDLELLAVTYANMGQRPNKPDRRDGRRSRPD
jgi:hypothetical protein